MTARKLLGGALLILLAAGVQPAIARTVQADDGKPRILCIGAHPDDAEVGAAGTAALWVVNGCHIKFVAVTNGDIGHWKESGPELARRRKAEVEHGAKLVGCDFEILDNHDGELIAGASLERPGAAKGSLASHPGTFYEPAARNHLPLP